MSLHATRFGWGAHRWATFLRHSRRRLLRNVCYALHGVTNSGWHGPIHVCQLSTKIIQSTRAAIHQY